MFREIPEYSRLSMFVATLFDQSVFTSGVRVKEKRISGHLRRALTNCRPDLQLALTHSSNISACELEL